MRKYSAKRRRAMYKGDRVRALCLFVMYDWKCGLCGEDIDPLLRYPNPDCATIDHIIPISKGGPHVWENCQPSHLRCNQDKSDRLNR